jgi:hypothetical protein
LNCTGYGFLKKKENVHACLFSDKKFRAATYRVANAKVASELPRLLERIENLFSEGC